MAQFVRFPAFQRSTCKCAWTNRVPTPALESQLTSLVNNSSNGYDDIIELTSQSLERMARADVNASLVYAHFGLSSDLSFFPLNYLGSFGLHRLGSFGFQQRPVGTSSRPVNVAAWCGEDRYGIAPESDVEVDARTNGDKADSPTQAVVGVSKRTMEFQPEDPRVYSSNKGRGL
ncbi:hypothetical protein DFH29DRAFT_1071409 [Suillus ampliporus]|nr:hypothetical protein DFH29DRAFT_1071409 [Suillus ampliporus]